MSYKDTLLGWLGKEESSFWEHASDLSGFDTLREAIHSEASNDLLFKMADSLAKDIKANHDRRKKERPRSIHLIPHEDQNGTVSFYNKRTGELVTCMPKRGNNKYEYIGPFDYGNPLTSMYGRGGVAGQGSPYDQISDGKFFNYGSGKNKNPSPVFYFIGSGENFNYEQIGKMLSQYTKEKP